MQTTSATYDRILAGTDYSYETRLIIDGVGTFGESDIMSISTNIEMFQEDPEVGKAIASEINVVMFNPSVTIPNMATLRPQVRACGTAPKSSKVTITDEDLASTYATYSSENITFSSSSGATVAGENLSFAADTIEYLESEWLPQGIFYVDTREVTQNNNGLDVLTMHGFDAMLKTEQIYSSNVSVGNNLDIAYVRAIASAIGVTVDPRTWEIMQTGYMIPFPLGYTMREILGYIASAYAGCFIINDVGQLRLVALEDIESETRYLIDEIGNIIVFGVDSSEHTVTASGAVATFTAGGEYALDDLEIAIEPVQSGSGDPSPDNIRPISGWTGMDINNAPTVLSLEQGGLYDANGGEADNANRIRTAFRPVSDFSKSINVLGLLQNDNVDVRFRRFYWYTANNTFIETTGTFNSAFPVELVRSSIPDNAVYYRIVLQNVNNSLAITPEGYHLSINATTIPISWQTEAGTVYKGTLNVLTGVLTVTHASKTFTSASDISKINTTAWYIEASKIPSVKNPSAGEATVMSDKFKPAYPATTGGCFLNTGGAIRFNTATEYSNSTALMAALGSIQFMYPLSSALTFQLSPTQVKTLLGHNNLWANTGNIINLEFVEPATEAVRILV